MKIEGRCIGEDKEEGKQEKGKKKLKSTYN